MTTEREAPAGGRATHCPYCSLQCAMTLRPGAGGAVEVLPRDFPTNRGGLCQKGWTAAELLDHPERLTVPLVRARAGDRTSALVPARWDEALGRVSRAVRGTQARHGRDAVAVFGGGGLTNEKAYALGKFARVVLRTSRIDYNGRFCMSSAAAASTKAFGLDRGLPFPLEDVAGADAVLLVGSNLAETMPPVMAHFQDMRRSGGRLIVVDPRRTRTAQSADLHLQPLPGTDLALALGLLHLVVVRGYVDEDYVAERTTGWEEVRRAVASWWPERVEAVTGVSVHDLHATAEILAGAAPSRGGRGAMLLTARGAEQHSKGVDTVLALTNLALALGLPGRPHSGYGCLTGQGNGQGGREHGQKADQLPGYRRIDDPDARSHVADVWGVDPATLPGPGLSAYELLDALGTEGGPRALFLAGSNPVVSAPNAGHVTQRLAALDFLCVVDLVLSETAALADVVLPTAQWAEETGTVTNLEGRVLLRPRAVPPPPGVRTDLQILHDLADRLGAGRDFPHDAFPVDAEQVFGELGAASAGGVSDYSEIDYQRLAEEPGVFWGRPRMFTESFPTPDGRARFHSVSYRPVDEDIDETYPLLLTTGRVLAQYQSGAQTRRVPALNESAPGPFVEMHPGLAASLGVSEGEDVRVVGRRGEAVVPARLTHDIRTDTVFMPFHWPGTGRANALTSEALDPVSRMPEFKACAVRVERVEHEPVAA